MLPLRPFLLSMPLALLTVAQVTAAVFNIPDGDVAALKAALTTANSNGEADIISLAAGGTYLLTSIDNTTNGPNGLPVIVNDLADLDLSIQGNGARISTLNHDSRILCIASGAQVRLSNLRLTNGEMHDIVSGGGATAGNGGAIYNLGGLTLQLCTLSGNDCDSTVGDETGGAGGGALYNAPGATVEVTNSSFAGNTVARNGGAIYNAGSLIITSSMLFSNSGIGSQTAGGAIYTAAGGNTSITNSTLGSNSASFGRGIYNRAVTHVTSSTFSSSALHNQGAGASLYLGSNILQEFSRPALVNNSGVINSLGHNLSADAAGGDGSAGPGGYLNADGDIRNTDPQLGSPGIQWGGLTATFPLGSNSPAIDKGVSNSNTTDQRGPGFPRTIDLPNKSNGTGDGTDIGAFEFIPGTVPAPGQLIISEFRFRGPTFDPSKGLDGAYDEFVELYNTTAMPLRLNTVDGSNGLALAYTDASGGSIQPVTTIAENTIIPAFGHYLLGSESQNDARKYTLGDQYASANAQYSVDIPDNAGIALFQTSNPSNFSLATRLDAVSLNNANGTYSALFREGTFLSSPGANDGPYSYVRRLTSGAPQDSDDNAADFVFVSTNAASYGGVPSQLGAPGPEATGLPVQSNALFEAQLIEPNNSASAAPNQVRNLTAVPNGTQGTLSIRRHFVNRSGVTITNLRFRVVDITTLNTPGYTPGGAQADLRALTSTAFNINTSRGALTVRGTTLEGADDQPNGGGLNCTLVAEGLGAGLAPNAAVDLQLVVGVQQGGSYRFAVNLEAFPGGSSSTLRVASMTRPANGHFVFQGTGVANAAHVIEKSTTLTSGSFSLLNRVTANSAGAWQYDDASSIGLTRAFYRVGVAPLLVQGGL